LRQALFLKIREPVPAEALAPGRLVDLPGNEAVRGHGGRLELGRKDPRFWPAVGLVLDVLQAVQARVAEAAGLLGISTANLIDFLRTEAKVWEQANHLRAQFGQKPLRNY
jgi:hypothetical protein